MRRVTVLGGGNTSFSLAAQLALGGYEVVLGEHPAFATAIEPIRARRVIQLDGAGRTGAATLEGVTTEIGEALAWSETVLVSVPSYAHEAFFEACLPHLRMGHVIALLPGNLGTFAFAKALRSAGVSRVTLVESDSAPYVCRKTVPDRATIFGVLPALGLGVFPATRTEAVMPQLRELLPGARAYPNALVAGLSALNPIVHPPGVLMNAGRIERSRGEFYFYDEGVTPAVVRAIEALDAERRALGAALGIELTPVAKGFHEAGFGPDGDLWEVINGSRMLTAMRAPGAVETRWLTEDVPYGLITWASLAKEAKVATPVMDALITLAGAVVGRDFQGEGRTVEDLGLAGLDAARLKEYAETSQ